MTDKEFENMLNSDLELKELFISDMLNIFGEAYTASKD